MITFCKLLLNILPKCIRQRFQFSNDGWKKNQFTGAVYFWMPCTVQTRGNHCWLHVLLKSHLTNLLETLFQARQQQLLNNSNADDSNLLTIMITSFIVILDRIWMTSYWNREDWGRVLYLKGLSCKSFIDLFLLRCLYFQIKVYEVVILTMASLSWWGNLKSRGENYFLNQALLCFKNLLIVLFHSPSFCLRKEVVLKKTASFLWHVSNY